MANSYGLQCEDSLPCFPPHRVEIGALWKFQYEAFYDDHHFHFDWNSAVPLFSFAVGWWFSSFHCVVCSVITQLILSVSSSNLWALALSFPSKCGHARVICCLILPIWGDLFTMLTWGSHPFPSHGTYVQMDRFKSGHSQSQTNFLTLSILIKQRISHHKMSTRDVAFFAPSTRTGSLPQYWPLQ